MKREDFVAAVETLSSAVDIARYLEQLDEIFACYDEQRAEIERLQAERDEFRSLNEHHKEQFLKTNSELATAKEVLAKVYEAPPSAASGGGAYSVTGTESVGHDITGWVR